ncbi:3-deoxy-7-phosphoheptulonate synthase [Simkania negevensis]|uniref:Phospho-2-dehydro-3-deoxyheptonate aldolase n=1 Tax=Simkania negevensis (strain ATCC VR-1471 / DSM 27360 / Z) TaxID=331113 RepID=F8L7Z8_SIMNZ|nr:3-deoxy-7-phosphoheptulonate synthase [Simkania negevensis]MCB1067936.1 3-deoxy-7-phosphoheptulonate synthase [Simkania sp.]MCB1075180.1 3-deoxy-7-phosphoheptulonate synthase [Simkania sp.]CCB88900.1 phospho-2-dehydro-3-deoxyheptonate aldolase [Simkania negevensis Z]
MIIVLKKETTLADCEQLIEKLEWMGFEARISEAQGRFSIAIIKGIDDLTDINLFKGLPHVAEIADFKHPFKLAAREFQPRDTVISIKGIEIGGDTLAIMAGPCSIESKEQIMESARIIASEGVRILRGGAFKPRTSPYAFQGLEEKGLQYMKEAAEKYNLITISEVMDGDQIELMSEYVDILQIGARNMQNFTLLKKLGNTKCAIFLKRGLSATYQDLLMSAEYVLDRGNSNVMLCERGIRTFETYSRNTLDLAAVPILQDLTHLPIIVDPSHGTGIRKMVCPMALAGVAAGADGLMVEMHPEPDKAVSDKQQTISPEAFRDMMQKLRTIGPAVNMKIPSN